MACLEFEQLPDDVLLEIISFLYPRDIVRVRQINDRFRELTTQKSLWIRAYRRNSELFLSPLTCVQRVDDIERILLRAETLDQAWTRRARAPSGLELVRSIPYTQCADESTFCQFLDNGRYLLLIRSISIAIFDLEVLGTVPVVQQVAEEGTRFHLPQSLGSPADIDTEGIYIPVLATRGDASYLMIWNFRASRTGLMEEVTNVNVSVFPRDRPLLYGSRGVVVFDQGVSGLSVYDNKTHKIYHLSQSTGSENPWKTRHHHQVEYFPSFDSFVAIHTDDRVVSPTAPPRAPIITIHRFDPPSDKTAYEIIQTHSVVCPKTFTEPKLLSSISASPGCTTLHLAAIFLGVCFIGSMPVHVQVFSVTIHTDSSLSFLFPFETPRNTGCFTLTGLMLSSDESGRARAVCRSRSCMFPFAMQTLLIELTPGEFARSRGLDMHVGCSSYPSPDKIVAFDGFSGRICVTKSGDYTLRSYDIV
ncbi:hypothetical protein V5O48_004662 [Marasmius crinis-equi]|uniref:F-box domain-containing protein n=1 Tax=Marasmius crinis-equi TaxID=585013 RepID=A0ABR3FPG4_9AGAR